MRPNTALKLWLVLNACTRDEELMNFLSGEEWMEVSRHVASLLAHCPDCGEVLTDPLAHYPCSRAKLPDVV